MSKETKFLIILTILLVASFFRLWDLNSVPPGLYPDVAMNGNDAIQALESGHFKVFYPENNGREGLFINLIALSFKAFGPSVWSLRLMGAIAGILTVLALYFLTKELFNFEIASISSFMLAVSFWHVNFSRLGFRAILAPLILILAFYFFWRGLKTAHILNFGVSGLFWGLGFYTYLSFRITPLILILVMLAYWQTIKRDYGRREYLHIRNRIIAGFALLMLVAIFVFMPLGIYYLKNPQDFMGRTGQLSVFSSEAPLKLFLLNLTKTFGMFNFDGDWNWRHNFAGSPQLFWPMGALFMVGFLKTCLSLFKYIKKGRKYHGHFSTIPVLILSWFFIGLLPAILSNEGVPHALRVIMVIPPVFIMVGKGTWWFFEYLRSWYAQRDIHPQEASAVVVLVIVIFMASLGFAEYSKYFDNWAKNKNVEDASNKNYTDLGYEINKMPLNVKKYVYVNVDGVLVQGIPVPAQTVMFITDTSTPEKQKQKNIYYLTKEQYKNKEYDQNSIIFPLEK